MSQGDKKNICIFSSLYAPSLGGVQTYTQNLAGALAGLGHNVSVICCNTNSQAAFEVTSGVRVHRIPCRNYLNGRFPVPKKGTHLKATLAEIAKRGVDYVVLNAKFYELTSIGAKFAREHGVAPILIEHGSAALTIGNPVLDVAVQSIEKYMTRRTMKYSPFCYGVSAKASAWLSHFGIQASGELYNSINAHQYAEAGASCNRDLRLELQLNNNDFLVCSIGRLVPEKGVLEIVEAAEILANTQSSSGAACSVSYSGVADRANDTMSTKSVCSDNVNEHANGASARACAKKAHGTSGNDSGAGADNANTQRNAGSASNAHSTSSDANSCAKGSSNSDSDSNKTSKIHFAIAGDGPLLSALKHLAATKNLSNVHILGRTTPAESSALLSQSQIYCLPSRSEGFATTLLEAAACATPAIVTSVGGCDELIRNQNFGTIIPNAKAATIAKAIENACATPEALAKQGENIRTLVQQEFSWEKTALAVLSACEEHN